MRAQARLSSKFARRGMRGMTLLEIMIVVAILGMLSSVIVVSVMNQFTNAKISATRLKVESTEKAVQQYYVQVGEYPSQSEGLKAVVNPPDGSKGMLDSVPKDEFGHELKYYNPPRKNKGAFEVFSVGEDGQEGTEDDIYAKKK